MDNLIIEPTKFTPGIMFDGENNLLEIRGESYAQDTRSFYEPVLSWVEQYTSQLKDKNVTVNMELPYFNSSAVSILIRFFEMLDDAAAEGNQITLNWIYEEGDDDGIEFGEEFQEDIKEITFNLVPK